MSDEFEMQLQSLKPAGVSSETYERLQIKVQGRERGSIKWSIVFAGIAVAACVALVVLLVDRSNLKKQYEVKLAQRNMIAIKDDKPRTSVPELQKTIDDLNKKIDDQNKKTAMLAFRLGHRVTSVEATIRRSDGSILTVAADKIVYINLGMGDHIVPGMTFEVYAKDDGVPALGDGMRMDEMPIGVASIEVQQVNAASSQCRVIKVQPGLRISQGDLIANLVYDRNTKYNFVVYGNFDMAQTGHPNLADADVIKSLVVGWGGKIQKGINVDTDFVVMGAEPVVEELRATADEFEIAAHKDQLQAKADYQKMLAQAVDLHIPIMNQNRFLYFCGYYDLATR